jgi:diguanylate cyclase (GGDEF)-like protein
VAERLRASLAEAAVRVEGSEIPIRASFGVYSAEPTPGPAELLDDILAKADAAMYAAKRAGRDRCVLWSAELG